MDGKPMMQFLIVTITCFFSFFAYGQVPQQAEVEKNDYVHTPSLRTIGLLPITGPKNEINKQAVFNELQNFLKDSNWCVYRTNRSFLELLSAYEENLETHLNNPKVIQVLTNKLQVGSLIKISITPQVEVNTIAMRITDGSGFKILYENALTTQRKNTTFILEILKEWLLDFSDSIPYDGRVLKVEGDKITLDIGARYNLKKNFRLFIERDITYDPKFEGRFIKKAKWRTQKIASGLAYEIDNDTSLAIAKKYEGDAPVKPGDWVVVNRSLDFGNQRLFYEHNPKTTRKVGKIQFLLESSRLESPSNSQISATIFGLNIQTEFYFSNKWLAKLEVARNFGSASGGSVSLSTSNAGVSNNVLKLIGGYNWSPRSFPIDAYFDFYLGYSLYSYNLDAVNINGFSVNSFGGFSLGTYFQFPLKKNLNLRARGEYIPFASYDEDEVVFGNEDSVTSFQLEGGIDYKLKDNLNLTGLLEYRINSASFTERADSKLEYRDSLLKIGIGYEF